jgi:AcrR family transcriptional regulator
MPKVLPEYLEQRRKQILDAAADCFYKNGFHQTSMSDICEAANLSPGAIYRYFRGKDEIITAICDESHAQELELIESIKTQGDSLVVLSQLGRAFLQEMDQADVRMHIDLLAEMPRSEHIRQSLQEGAENIIGSFAAFIRDGQARGEIRADLDPEAVASVMCALYHGYLVQQQIGCAVDAELYIETVLGLFEVGLFSGSPARQQAVLAH